MDDGDDLLDKRISVVDIISIFTQVLNFRVIYEALYLNISIYCYFTSLIRKEI